MVAQALFVGEHQHLDRKRQALAAIVQALDAG